MSRPPSLTVVDLLCLLLLSGLSAVAQVAPTKTNSSLPFGFLGDDPLWHCHSCQFPVYKDGGLDGMMRAIGKNLHFPPGLQTDGRVFVRFTIDKTGQVQNVIVQQAFYPEADSIAVRAVRLLGRFSPALDPRGRPIAVKQTIPITFSVK
ncbi:energy transducer TonB [Hymenobacter psychrophilus]|uniref:TonB protein C-terminal n=1 Tax=Hymenobacter psychrophilus TaxID=651662 RepID=A0A1H3HQP3_9BACT|nr:TonB family protein [Hymenobacter psychrophilus]SDY17565.1 TonB protein C-terminal [Hymenobacter psychrophilus]